MYSVKGCEVCGGLVRPVGGEGSLGYCTKCGIVYYLGEASGRGTETIQDLGEKFSEERGGPLQVEEEPHSMAPDAEAKTSRGHCVCPDCGTRFEFDDESDLTYVKREHFREFHPNRLTP